MLKAVRGFVYYLMLGRRRASPFSPPANIRKTYVSPSLYCTGVNYALFFKKNEDKALQRTEGKRNKCLTPSVQVNCFLYLVHATMANYTDMTEEEYNALDEELTRTIPKLGPNGTGFLSRREMRLWGLTNQSVNYLLTKAAADQKSPVQIIDELVCKEIAAASL